jgi:hypothetical protein
MFRPIQASPHCGVHNLINVFGDSRQILLEYQEALCQNLDRVSRPEAGEIPINVDV